MTQKLFTIVFLFLSAIAIAQSTDLDKNYVEAKFVKLPSKPILNDADRTFSVASLNSEVLTQSFSQYYFESEIHINGFTKLNADAYIYIESKLIDVNIINSEVISEAKSSTDKDGKVTRWTEYEAQVQYRTQGEVIVSSVDGSINEVFNFTKERGKTSKTTKSYKTADSFRKKHNVRSLRTEFVKNVIDNVNLRLENLFGYAEKKSKFHLWILDSKKHPENESHKANFTIVKNAFEGMNSYEPVDNIKKKVQPALDYFNSIIAKYPEDNRKSKKLRYASLYNIGWINYYLDNVEASKEYADKIIENGNSKSDGKALGDRSNFLKELFATNETDTRHLQIITEDKSNYYQSGNDGQQVQGSVVEFNPEEDSDYSFSFAITAAGDTIPGYVNIANINKLSNSVKLYVKDLQGKVVPRVLAAYEVDLLLLGNGEKRYTIPFKEATDAINSSTLGRASNKFVKRIYTSEKINLYEHKSNELVIIKTNSKKGFSTSSAGWLMSFRKKLDNLIEDSCVDLKERIKEKEFANNTESLIAFMKAYNECE